LNDSLVHPRLWGLPMPLFIGQAILLCFILLLATPTWAQTQTPELIDTLHKIKKNAAIIRLGYRENSVPFSFLVDNQPIGYSIDLCNAIVKEISVELGIEVRVDYRPVTTHNRFLLLVSGGIDLECGSSSITSERKKQSAFSPIIFVTGTKLLVKRDSPVTNLRDLRNKTVVLTRDTSNADAIERLSQKQRLGITFVFGEDHDKSFDILASGKADAFANDDVLLHGWIANTKMSGDYRVIGGSLSYEPLV
jgi:glutamate/aspartate transport system substrate-binding protein